MWSRAAQPGRATISSRLWDVRPGVPPSRCPPNPHRFPPATAAMAREEPSREADVPLPPEPAPAPGDEAVAYESMYVDADDVAYDALGRPYLAATGELLEVEPEPEPEPESEPVSGRNAIHS